MYERKLFTVKDEKYKNEGFLDEVKHFYTDLINIYVRNDTEKLEVFDRSGPYLATKKVRKNNPKAEQIEADNKHRQEWNNEVDIRLPEEAYYQIGKYRRMRKVYLKEYRKVLYMELILSGKMNEHLHQVDEMCYQMKERLVKQMKEKQGVTEKLKEEDQLMWVRMMNNISSCAEEIVLRELVYI